MLDWNRITGQMKKHGFVEWSEENIIKAVYPVSANKEFLHFSSGSPIEYSKCEPPQNWNDYINDIRFVINDRQKKTGNRAETRFLPIILWKTEKTSGISQAKILVFIFMKTEAALCLLQSVCSIIPYRI